MDSATGKYKQLTRTVKGTKREAQKALAAFVAEVDQGRTPTASKRLTLGEYLLRWLEAHSVEVSPRTLAGYRDNIDRYIKPHVGSLPLVKVTALDLQRLYSTLLQNGGKAGRGLSAQTVKHVHRLLFTALDRAEKMQLIARNPASLVRAPRVEAKEVPVINSADDVRRLLDCARDHRLYVGILIAITTGLRRGEICALRWQDVDLERGIVRVVRSIEATNERQEDGTRKTVLRVKDPKTKKGRRAVTLAPTVVDALRVHRRKQLEELVSTGHRPSDDLVLLDPVTGEGITPNAFSQAFRHLAEKAGVKVTLHGLRHSHLTALLAAGVPIKAVSERAGHSSISVTADVYGHVLDAMGAAAAAATEAWLLDAGRAPDQNRDQNSVAKRRDGNENVTDMRRRPR